jgi:uncharacterized OB-fold protein
LKLSKKLLITDNSDNIVAIVETDGKVLSNDKANRGLIKYYMTAPTIPTPAETKDKVSMTFRKPEDEDELIEVLETHLPSMGFKVK